MAKVFVYVLIRVPLRGNRHEPVDLTIGWLEVKGVYDTLEAAQGGVPWMYEKRSPYSFFRRGYGWYLISKKPLTSWYPTVIGPKLMRGGQ